MKIIILTTALIITLLIGLVVGVFAGRKATAVKYERMYPPELMEVMASNVELLNAMDKDEFDDLKKDMKASLEEISNEWDLIIFAEGQLANDFCKTMDKNGAEAARRRAIAKLINFRERYEKGMDLPHGWDKVSDALHEHTEYAISEHTASSND